MDDGRRILVTGSTGLVGRRLVEALRDDGLRVGTVTRSPERARFADDVEPVRWDGVRVAPEELARSAAVVHLAGEPVFGGLFTADRRRRILESRVDSTRALVRAIGELAPDERPKVFVCASASGYYGDRGEEELDEDSPPGEGFLADVCIAWEKAAQPVEKLGVRRVSLRIGVVLAREGGALVPMARAFRFGLGGRIGSGRQWWSWVALSDTLAAYRFALENEISGPVNLSSPNPATNAQFVRALGRALRRPTVFSLPGFAVKAAFGEMGVAVLLEGQRTLPARLLAMRFEFSEPNIDAALECILER